MNEVIKSKDNKLWKKVDKPGLLGGYVEINAPTVEPTCEWTGGKISGEDWRMILASFKWSQETHRCESLVRGYYNPETQLWKFTMLHQEKGGMTVKEKDCEENRLIVAGLMAEGYHEYFSAHHHCSSSAFQSGTDSNDESSREGLHITIGNIGSPAYSIHARALVKQGSDKQFYEPYLDEWFEMPQDIGLALANLKSLTGISIDASSLLKKTLTTPPPEGTLFPEEWKARLQEPMVILSSTKGTYPQQQSMGYGGSKDYQEWKDRDAKKVFQYMAVLCSCEDNGDLEQWMKALIAFERARKAEAWVSPEDVGKYALSDPTIISEMEYYLEQKKEVLDFFMDVQTGKMTREEAMQELYMGNYDPEVIKEVFETQPTTAAPSNVVVVDGDEGWNGWRSEM